MASADAVASVPVSVAWAVREPLSPMAAQLRVDPLVGYMPSLLALTETILYEGILHSILSQMASDPLSTITGIKTDH